MAKMPNWRLQIGRPQTIGRSFCYTVCGLNEIFYGVTYLHWAWKYLMRFWRKSTPFFTLISFTFRRYCREKPGEKTVNFLVKNVINVYNWRRTLVCWDQTSGYPWPPTPDLWPPTSHLTHLQLEEPTLLLHLLGDLSSAELGADHPVLLGVLPLLLLDLRSAEFKVERSKLLWKFIFSSLKLGNTSCSCRVCFCFIVFYIQSWRLFGSSRCFCFLQFGLVILPGFVKRLL